MSAKIKLPHAVARYTGGETKIEVEGSSIREVILHLGKRYDGIGKNFLDEHGRPKRSVRIYLNNVDIKKLDGLDTPVFDGDEIALVPAFIGG